MKHYNSPEVAEAYSQRIVDLVEGRRTMPAITYDGDRSKTFHASDFDDGLCILPAYYSRILENIPPLDFVSAQKFLRGRVIERAIAEEEIPIVKDDIHCTIDDKNPDFGIAEIKSTTDSHEFFDIKERPYWVSRMKTYCFASDNTKINLVVMFLAGNMASYLVWNIKNHNDKVAYETSALDAWTFEFEQGELEEHWKQILDRKETLEHALEKQTPFPKSWVEEFLPYSDRKSGRKYWQCEGCRYARDCYYYNEVILNART